MADEELQTVRTLLSAAGLHPPDDEVERLARLYPGLRRRVDRFHQIDVGDEVTAAVFRADAFSVGYKEARGEGARGEEAGDEKTGDGEAGR